MAATGTPTPNLGLRRAQGTDPASVDDINYNSELLDTKLGAVGATSVQEQIDALSASTAQTFGNVQDGLAIVSNGNTHVAIPAGYWVYVKGHGTLSEGLYKNTSGATIAANATLSTSNLTADPDGGLNSVYDALNSKTTVTVNPANGTLSNDSVLAKCAKNIIIAGTFTASSDISGYSAILNNIPYTTGVIPFTGIKTGGSVTELYVSGSSVYTRSAINNGDFLRFTIMYIAD